MILVIHYENGDSVKHAVKGPGQLWFSDSQKVVGVELRNGDTSEEWPIVQTTRKGAGNAGKDR